MADDPLNDKLIAAKEKWAKEGRGLTGEIAPPSRRLPAGQHLSHDLPVLDLGTQPNMPAKDWSLTVAGQCARPLKWTFADLLAQPQTDITCDIHCVTTWSCYDMVWSGVSTHHLIQAARVKPEARFVMIRGFDGYTTNLPLEQFADAKALIAHSWQNQPLPREHGGPVRLVIPQLYFWKSAKWVRAITFMDKDCPGYWEQRGYHPIGDPWKEERYS